MTENITDSAFKQIIVECTAEYLKQNLDLLAY